MDDQLEMLLAERAITRALHTYSRGADRLERHDDEWRIAERVCAFESRRTDPVVGEGGFADTSTRGQRGPDDVVWTILD